MAVPYETARALAELSGDVLSAADASAAVQLVAQAAVALVPGCDGASVTVRRDGRPAVSAADAEWAVGLDEEQFQAHEGPCLDCMREGSLMRVRDLAQDSRWPEYGPRAAEQGARSVVSYPLASVGRTVGALNLYSRQPDAYDDDLVALGELLAAHASLALQVAMAFQASQALADGLREAMSSRAVIEQAKGILMARERCDEDAAFDALRRASQAENVKLREIAARVVDDAVQGRS